MHHIRSIIKEGNSLHRKHRIPPSVQTRPRERGHRNPNAEQVGYLRGIPRIPKSDRFTALGCASCEASREANGAAAAHFAEVAQGTTMFSFASTARHARSRSSIARRCRATTHRVAALHRRHDRIRIGKAREKFTKQHFKTARQHHVVHQKQNTEQPDRPGSSANATR